MTVLNWCYSCKAPFENLESVEKQIWLAHQYKNKRIEIERERRLRAETYARSLHYDFEAACVIYDEMLAAYEAAKEPVLRARQLTRKRVEPTAEQDHAIKSAEAAMRAAYRFKQEQSREAYSRVSEKQKECRELATAELPRLENEAEGTWKNRISERARSLMLEKGCSAGEVEAYRAIKEARAYFSAQDLFWPTYSQVEAALSAIREGAPPQFKQYRGDGSVSVALRKVKLEDILNGKSNNLKIVVPPITYRMVTKGKDFGKQCQSTAYIRISSDEARKPVWAAVKYSYHRQLPEDAVITQAHLDRRRIGTRVKWKLRLTLKTEQASRPAANNELVIVHFGHRVVPAGLRVATAIDSTGAVLDELIISRADMDRYSYPDVLVGLRAECANAVLDEFEAWVKSIQLNDEWAERFEHIGKWRGPHRLHKVVRIWDKHRFAADQASSVCMPLTLAWARAKLAHYQTRPNYKPRETPDLSTVYGLMRFWFDFDCHMLDWSDSQRASVRRKRDAQFRDFAARLAKQYGHLGIADINWARLREAQEEDVFKIKFTAEHRRLAGIAAPGRCSLLCVERFRGNTTKVKPSHITSTCHVCGNLEEFDHTALCHTCSQCQTTWDQDVNAARNTLARVNQGRETGDGVVVKTVKKKRLPRRNKPLVQPEPGPPPEDNSSQSA